MLCRLFDYICRLIHFYIPQDNIMDKKNYKGILSGLGKTAAWVIGIWLALMVVLQVILSPGVMTRIINNVAAEFIDGDISFGKASASVFKRFPKVTLSIEDFSITYPAERFDSLERAGAQGHLLHHGCGETADTLASFDEFSASLSLLPLLKGTIRIPHVNLVKPRIFAHSYDEENANWNLFVTGGEDEEKDEKSSLPDIVLGNIKFTEHPHIVYTDSKDTVFAMIDLHRFTFNGKINTGRSSRTRLGIMMDSLFVAGRSGSDTLAAGIDRLHIHEHHKHMDLHAQAKAMLATQAFGRMVIPMDIRGTVSFPKDSVTAVSIRNLKADIATMPILADADIRLHKGRTGIKGNIRIDSCRIQDLLDGYVKNFIPEVRKVKTDARICLNADIDGYYNHADGRLPETAIRLSLSESELKHKDFPHEIRLGMEAEAEATEDGTVNARLSKMHVNTFGLSMAAKGGAQDLLGEDPLLDLDGSIRASFDSLQTFIPDTMGLTAGGRLAAHIKGNARISHLDMYNFSKADLSGEVTGSKITLEMPEDTISVDIDSIGLHLGPENITSRRDPSRTFRLLALTGHISNADVKMGSSMAAKGKGLSFSAKNSVPKEGADSADIRHLGGRISAGMLTLTDSEGTSISLDETSNGFQIMPKRGQPKVPVLSLTSRNKRITLATPVNRAILTDSEISASAAMNTVERKARRQAYMDSLSKVYPDVPKDSLFRHMMSKRAQREVPEWMQDEDFRKKDINIKLDETMARYFREWDLNGKINIRTGIVMTPYFPLRNILKGFECSFNNNEIKIDSVGFKAGKSGLAAKGALTGLRRAVLGRGTLKLDAGITSSGMDANELLRAYRSGMAFDPEASKDKLESATNSDFFQMVTTDTTSVSEEAALIVIPSNLNADIRLDLADITYSDLAVSKVEADVVMKERCVQITNTSARTNMGNMYFDGFYSTKTKKDIKTGFSLNLEDITAEKVIDLMPAIDTIIPLLKSFKGLLNCEMAATAQIDTNMNIMMPTINGVMRIGGEDLSISDNEMFRTLARKLMFKNKKEGRIDKMTVEGVIKDNTMEIFPFVLKVDRYTLAMSGLQNLDMSFKYHVSVLRSPFLFRLGIDLSGKDFDNMKFRIGKAKYKSTRVPVFSKVIDETKINLLGAIKGIFEKGVDVAVKENEKQEAIEKLKSEIGYVNAVDQELEALSEAEQKEMEEAEAKEAEAQAAEESLQATLQEIRDKMTEEINSMNLDNNE